ncbi:MAG: hypothetical protein KJ737_15925 [Proteobacteria bacterium]|nr:hypothetical protein [Pseudomonadota bacterium]
MNNRFYKKIEEIYIGDTKPLFEGTVRIQDAISKNVKTFIKENTLFTWWGVTIDILVTSRGHILYPQAYVSKEASHGVQTKDLMQTARENFDLLNGGLKLKVDLTLPHNTALANSVLGMYLIIFGAGLYVYFSSGYNRARSEEYLREQEIDRLHGVETVYVEKLSILEKERESLSSKIEKIRTDLNDEKKRASVNEDEMINEIVTLEEKLEKNVEISNLQKEEIDTLHEKLTQYEKRAESKKKKKDDDHIIKRFKALYKNVDIAERAVDGFVDLTEDMKIKAEEIIHHLNEDAGKVIIKRKVFNKKSNLTFFELQFSYKGRLYFQKKKDGKVEILVIGTKNTQPKDLEYLDNL